MFRPKTKCWNCGKNLSNRRLRAKKHYCSVKCKREYLAKHRDNSLITLLKQKAKIRKDKKFVAKLRLYNSILKKIEKLRAVKEEKKGYYNWEEDYEL